MTLKEKMNLIEKNIEYSMNNRQRIFFQMDMGCLIFQILTI